MLFRSRATPAMSRGHLGGSALATRRPWSVSEEGCGYDRDSVFAAVGVGAGGDDGGVEKVGSDAFVEPLEVADVVVVDRTFELDLEGDDSLVCSFNDEVDLVLAASSSQVADSCFVGSGVDTHREGDERFEQGAEQGAVLGNGRALMGIVEQTIGA